MSSDQKYHWYLVSGRSVEGTHNKTFGLSNQNITKKHLDWFKECMVEQSVKHGLPCSNLVLLNISYLGEMSEVEFSGGDE